MIFLRRGRPPRRHGTQASLQSQTIAADDGLIYDFHI
jgi:hypothetical protein